MTYAPPPDKPAIPAGWTPQFDHNSQRWYYFNTATGRSQWEAPVYYPPPTPPAQLPPQLPAQPPAQSPAPPAAGGGIPGPAPAVTDERGAGAEGKKKSGHGGMLLGAAGGLAAGALLAHALHKKPKRKHCASR